MKKCIVYGLASSSDGEIRYIGQTAIGLEKRIIGHRSKSLTNPTTPVNKWIKKLIDECNDVIGIVINSDAIWHETEKEVIAFYRKQGARLLNLTDGGEGTIGFRQYGRKRPDLSERNKQNIGKPGRKLSLEENEALQKYRKTPKPYVAERNKSNHPWIGKKHKDETKKKMSEWQKGIPKWDDDGKKKLSEIRKKWWESKRAETHAY